MVEVKKMKYRKLIEQSKRWAGIGFLICLGACSDSTEGLENKEPEYMELPISFNVEQLGGQQTKTPGNDSDLQGIDAKRVRPVYVDHILLNVFKRRTGEEHFFLDDANRNIVLKCQEYETFPYYKARGSINIQKNHEYRMTATGYSTKMGEDTLFVRNPDRKRFDHARLELTDKQEYRTPEFFFGTPLFEGKETFSFEEMEEKKGSGNLEGWLYRGVAGIELNLENVTGVQKIELLADSIHTMVNISHYDDFLAPYEKKRDGKFHHFVIGADSLKEGEEEFKENEVHITGANLLPVCTSLSLRITKKATETGKPGEVLYTRMQLFETRLISPDDTITYEKPVPGWKTRSIPDDAGNGTGIIPDNPDFPENPDEPDGDKNPYTVCFQRNHYYRIVGDYDKLNTMQYVFNVVVNPNWDRTVNLSLDKSGKSGD
jgi:hypothetical protein